jgi:GntR family transcriptional repressor for pyruvate dehydrogenase complex
MASRSLPNRPELVAIPDQEPRNGIRPPSAEEIADLILNAILTGGHRPGDRLPSERELGSRYAVSRTVIRQALHQLVAHGVVEIRAGRGPFVAQVESSVVASAMRLYVQTRVTPSHSTVHEVRVVVEPELSAFAAERATDTELARLEAVMAAHEDAAHELVNARGPRAAELLERVLQLDYEFHRMIGEAAHNDLFMMMLAAIAEPLMAIRRAAMALPGNIGAGVMAHRTILRDIASRDRVRARATMAHHLEVSEQAWQALLEEGSSEEGLDQAASVGRP